jgi:hypothetical protein
MATKLLKSLYPILYMVVIKSLLNNLRLTKHSSEVQGFTNVISPERTLDVDEYRITMIHISVGILNYIKCTVQN